MVWNYSWQVFEVSKSLHRSLVYFGNINVMGVLFCQEAQVLHYGEMMLMWPIIHLLRPSQWDNGVSVIGVGIFGHLVNSFGVRYLVEITVYISKSAGPKFGYCLVVFILVLCRISGAKIKLWCAKINLGSLGIWGQET